MEEGLLSAIRGVRFRLNAAIVAYRALAWAAPAGLASGLLVALLRAMGIGAGGFPLWAALVAAGAAAGAARAWESRLGDAEAARWLDGRLADGELLSAALACLGREPAGRFDASIVEGAVALVPRASAQNPSPRPMAKKAAIAALACAAGAYVIFLAAPFSGSIARAQAARGGTAGPASAAEAAAIATARGDGVAASAFASSLFPDDRRLATLAERALREGRLDELRDLLKAAELDYSSKIARALGEGEKKSLARDRERIREAASAFSPAGGPGGPGGGGESPGGPRGKPGDGEGGRGGISGQGGTAEVEGGSAGPGNGGGSGKGTGAGAGRGAGRGGSRYGEGSGAAGEWGRIEPSAGTARAEIMPPKDAAFFELVLPGHDAAASISALLPDSRRSAESAISREGVPLQYEEFLRSYFLALSKGESR